MDFHLTTTQERLRDQVRAFIAERIIPFEADPRQTAHGPGEELRQALNEHARAAGLLSPHASRALGGLGLSHVDKAVVFEEAGYSPLGPLALHIHAPDEGNLHLLELLATEEQRQRWLEPLARAEIRSCFAMTEPAPGAGSDPSLMQTTAVRDGDGYRINGTKWLVTGARGAAFVIVVARMPDGTATLFLADMNAAGIELERLMPSLDEVSPGGHGVMHFRQLWVGAGAVLGEVGRGFQHAQARLAPARLTHCMRWLGLARRAHDTALAYARDRRAFGKSLGEHEGVGFMLADNSIDLQTARLLIWHSAWLLDQGQRGTFESSQCKLMVSEAVSRVVDRSVQMLGGQGVTSETVVAGIYRGVRAFRIYDGPSEVHRWNIARKLLHAS